MLKKILTGFAVALLIFLGFVALQSNDYHVTREIKINAPATAVFAHVNDLHKFNEWNPWAKLDPAAKQSYEGPQSGVGAVSIWDGNSDVGAGRMTITESMPPTIIRMRLDYTKPFQGMSNAEFQFKPEGSSTVVTWSNSGKKSFIPKIICVFLSMDKMIGGMFEKGLSQLKVTLEKSSQK